MNTVFAVQAVMGLVDNITGPLRGVRGGMAQTEAGAGRLSSKMGMLTKTLLPLAVAAGIVVGGFFSCVGATVETQAALGELSSVGITNLEALSNAGEQFSGKWAGTTKSQFISAAYDIKSGIASLSDEGVAEFTKLAALTGKATKSTTAEMTSLFATGYGIYKDMYADLTDMQFGEVFSAGIAASVKNFKTTGSGMAQAISQLGATATTAKVPLQEQLSILGMLQATMTGSEAGTKYKAMMQSAAGAGQKLNLQFMDANNQLLSMPEILAALQGKYGTTLDAIEKMEMQKAFGTQEAVAVIDLLYSKVGDLKTNIIGLSGAMDQGTAFTSAMAETMNRDLGAVLALNGQRFHNLKEIIGNIFLPVTLSLATGLGTIIGLFSSLARSTVGKTLIGLVGAIAVGVIAITAFASASVLVTMALPFVTGALASVGAAFVAVSWPVWAIVAAIGVLYIAWRKNFGGMADIVSVWWNKISLVFQGIRAVFSSLNGTTGMIEGELSKDIKAAGLVGLVTTVGKVIYRIKMFFSGMWDAVKFSILGIADIFRPVFASMGSVVTPLWDIFKALGSVIAQVGLALWGVSASTDISSWQTFGEVVGTFVGASFQMLAWAIRLVITPLKWAADIIGFLLSCFVGLGEGIGTAAGWIVVSLETLPALVSRIAGSISNAFSQAVGWIVGKITGLSDFFSGIDWSAQGVKLMGTLVAGIKWAFMNLTPVGWLIQAFSGVKSFLEGIDWSAQGAKLMSTLAAGIKSTVSLPFDLVKTGLMKVRNLLPFSDAKEGPLSALTSSGQA
ncbi:MAG: phage tail tape measure protein, partial [Proteobacteria bacterium]|nr:phage tail tape measure protein [Pseudomonadota bacterium]